MSSKEQSFVLAKWCREIGLVTLGSLVFPALTKQAPPLPAVTLGLAVSFLAYATAYRLLSRS